MNKSDIAIVLVGLGILVTITVSYVCRASLDSGGIVLAFIGLILAGLPSWAWVKLGSKGFEARRMMEQPTSLWAIGDTEFAASVGEIQSQETAKGTEKVEPTT